MTKAEEAYKRGYWKAYAQAIRDADLALQKRGDEQTIRHCRKAILALLDIEYHPEYIRDEPIWPHELNGIELALL